MMNPEYIIVQAGGKGTRMENLTRNKPKAMVPINNLPMMFHLFKKYPQKKYIIIGDYKIDVLNRYLKEFSPVEYTLVNAAGNTGTCSGIKDAISCIPDEVPFALIWCDLVLAEDYSFPDIDSDIIGISKDFTCRWKYEKGVFEEQKSNEQGVAGFFIFQNKARIANVPDSGEFVRWLKMEEMVFEEQPLYKTREYGLYDDWKKLPKAKCRPFNSLKIFEGKVYKEPIDDQGKVLSIRENSWYKMAQREHLINIPEIYSFNPLCMEAIDGKNVYEYDEVPTDQKKDILQKIVECLKCVHNLGSIPANPDSFRTAYLTKTLDRLRKVQNLVPFAQDPTIKINDRICRNIFFHVDKVDQLIMQYMPQEFQVIHGDCTFSNIMLRRDNTPVLIDPRGYFGNTELFGDPAYDWVKLFYSLYSNYDRFNLKHFDLYINEDDTCVCCKNKDDEITIDARSVLLLIESNNWEDLEEYFFELLSNEISRQQMKLFLALTWLSLTTYAWEDYDSICGAFYNGLYYLEEAFENESCLQ